MNFNKFKEAWFRGVYDKHFPELYFYLRNYITDEELIRDIIQDTFLSILEKDRLESIYSIRNYLFSCARNKLFNNIKSESIRQRIRTEMGFEQDSFFELDENREMSSISSEKMIILTEEAVNSLPVGCKTIFKMIKAEGMSYKQTAEKLSLSVKTIETQMGIAFRKIREYVSAAIIKIYNE